MKKIAHKHVALGIVAKNILRGVWTESITDKFFIHALGVLEFSFTKFKSLHDNYIPIISLI